jgi:hypothetical protein
VQVSPEKLVTERVATAFFCGVAWLLEGAMKLFMPSMVHRVVADPDCARPPGAWAFEPEPGLSLSLFFVVVDDSADSLLVDTFEAAPWSDEAPLATPLQAVRVRAAAAVSHAAVRRIERDRWVVAAGVASLDGMSAVSVLGVVDGHDQPCRHPLSYR